MISNLPIENVLIKHIRVNPHQPRSHFEPQALQELADSIVSVGLLQPPLVRKISNEEYELVAGERRLRACKLAKLTSIPVYIQPLDVQTSMWAALIENIQRSDLNPLEISRKLYDIQQSHQLTQQQLADKLSKKRSTISNYLRLLQLPVSIQKALEENQITMGHAKALLSLEDPLKQLAAFENLQKNKLSVHQLEKWVNQWQEKKTLTKVHTPDLFVQDLASRLQEHFGSKVHIRSLGDKKGVVEFYFHNLDELDHLLDRWNLPQEL